MDGGAFATGFGVGMGTGIATGIAIAATGRKSSAECLKKKIQEVIEQGEVRLFDRDGKALSAEEFVNLLAEKLG